MNTRVLVTGGSGFVASHLIDQLLERGYDVRATVRSLANAAKVEPLRALARDRKGSLELFEADLLDDGSFTDAMAGCQTVFHVASPFLLPEQIDDGEEQVVRPALDGMRNVLTSIGKTESVTRVVLTSTVGAIFGDYVDVAEMADGVLSEKYFNTTSTPENNPYHYSKVVAEKLAWEAADAQDRWSLVAINPGLILGPQLIPGSDSGSLFLMNELMGGQMFFGAAAFSFTLVDVRDVALAHVRAAENPTATGRYILARSEMVSLLDMGRIIRRKNPLRVLVPAHPVPDQLVRLIGPRFGLDPDFIAKHLGIRFPVDNTRSITELNIDYRPAAETVTSHFDSWRQHRK